MKVSNPLLNPVLQGFFKHPFIVEAIRNFPLISNLLDLVSGAAVTLSRASAKVNIKDSGTAEDLGNNAAAFTGSGILIEPSHTNLITYSRQLDNAAWTKGNCAISADTSETLDPFGGNNADKVTNNTGSTASYQQVLTHSSGATMLCSVMAKKGNVNWLQIQILDNVTPGNRSRVSFDLNNGAVGNVDTLGTGFTNVSQKITALDNGFYLCQCIVTAPAITASRAVYFPDQTDGPTPVVSNGDYIYAIQHDLIETNKYLTPVLTTTAAATSLKDDYSVNISSIPSNNFYIQFNWTPKSTAANGDYLLSFTSGANGNEIYFGTGTIESNGGCALSFTPVVGTTYIITLERDSVNGETLTVDGVGSNNAPAATGNITWPTTGYIGSRYSGGNHSHSVISNLKWDEA